MTVIAKKPKRKSPTKEADRLFSLWVRQVGGCEANDGRFPCAGNLQCAHGFSRRYRAVRWDRRNAFALCQGHHLFYTHYPIEWDNWLQERWGPDLYIVMRRLALNAGGAKTDFPELLSKLRAEVAA